MLCLLQFCKQSTQKLILQDTNTELKLVNGVLLFKDDPFSGVIESYYNSETIKSTINYHQGKKQGLEIIWHINDSLGSKRFYDMGLKVGIHKGWWQNGNPKFVYHFNDNGEYHGNIKEWYESGILFRDFNYLNGKEAGSQKMMYDTGKIKANYEVVNGERFGLIGLKKCYQVTVGSDEVK